MRPKPCCVKIPHVVKNLSFLIIVLLICGCSSSKHTIVSKPPEAAFTITGSVANASAFAKGGVLALGAFTAGTGAAADDETDQLSSMIIQGIKDTLPSENTHFTFPSDAMQSTDCFLEGNIDDYGDRVGHVRLKRNEKYLSIDGEIWLRSTSEKIFVFGTSTVINTKDQDPKDVAYRIGAAIAHYIGSQKS